MNTGGDDEDDNGDDNDCVRKGFAKQDTLKAVVAQIAAPLDRINLAHENNILPANRTLEVR